MVIVGVEQSFAGLVDVFRGIVMMITVARV